MSFVPSLAQTFETALAHHRRGCWAEALSVYRSLEARQPGMPVLTHLIIDVLEHQGSYEDANTEKQHLTPPYTTEIILTTAQAFLRVQSWRAAHKAYAQILAHDPQNIKALVGLSKADFALGHIPACLSTLDMAINLAPQSLSIRLEYAKALLEDGQKERALHLIKPILDDNPHHRKAARLLLDILPFITIDGAARPLETPLATILENAAPDDQNMIANSVSQHLLQDKLTQKAVKYALNGAWNEFYTLFESGQLSHLCMRPILYALMRSGPLKDARLIALNIAMRRCLLKYFLLHRTLDTWMQGLTESLAIQAARNEFLRPAHGAEQTALKSLKDQVATSLLSSDIDFDSIAWPCALLGCYEPLLSIPNLIKHVKRWQSAISQHPLKTVFEHHVTAPLQEQQALRSIKTLSEPTDTIAKRIESQYSAFPTPRWSNLHDFKYETLGDWLHDLNPHIALNPLYNGPIEVLFAGCGTGQNMVSILQTLAIREAVAVDLSKWTMAYAKTRIQHMLPDNTGQKIKFYRADIQDLRGIQRTFNAIIADDTIAETANPSRAIRNLVDYLAPGGVLQMTLPHKMGTQMIRDLKSHLVPLRLKPDLSGVHALQQEIWRQDAPANLVPARNLEWFHHTGGCIHNCFTAQKHAFQLREIEDLLSVCGLKLYALETPSQLKNGVAHEQPLAHDISGWQTMEQQNPALFKDGYRIWAYSG